MYGPVAVRVEKWPEEFQFTWKSALKQITFGWIHLYANNMLMGNYRKQSNFEIIKL